MIDILIILQWWFTFLVIGIIFSPFTTKIFSTFFDKGYIFSKVFGILFISYAIFLLGILKIPPFAPLTIFVVITICIGINRVIYKKQLSNTPIGIFVFEEFLFLIGIMFWSFIRMHQPDIHGLEKYMDYGFINSILKSEVFPPKDMWFTPFSINYYYFGHLVTAVLTKLSMIPLNITYNLMMATIFAFTFTCSFSIGANLFSRLTLIKTKIRTDQFSKSTFICGLLTAFLMSFAGNLHAIYTFFTAYPNENPVPFWQLIFSPQVFPNSYWYPNATRFIYNTIHEFPIYSFVVSDLHGHVLDIPFVLLTLAVLLSIVSQLQITKYKLLLLSFLLAIMYMTNAWDGLIYALLTLFVFIYLAHQERNYITYAKRYALVIFGFFLFALPFSLHFKPFVSGIGVLCAPDFLTDIGKFGPLLFEKDHCQHSPWWQLLILYGFFYFWAISFLVFLRKIKPRTENKIFISDIFVLLLIFLSTLLIIIPEFIYAKDIYPAHYRANTMFKLGYQAFIMLSICSGYIIIRIALSIRYNALSIKGKILTTCYLILTITLLVLVAIYPYFAITSYYGNLQTRYSLDGTEYLKRLYPTDYEAIIWLNKNIKTQQVILEAQGDSYTDFARISTHTGLPTLLGWTVHEWLWRGTYDIPSPRINEITTLYETTDIQETKRLIKKYNISLVFIGDLERQKYPELNEEKFKSLGKIIYQNGKTKIYQIL